MTTPVEPTYAVTYKVSGQSDIVKSVNACTGITADDILDAPDDDAIGDCADTLAEYIFEPTTDLVMTKSSKLVSIK